MQSISLTTVIIGSKANNRLGTGMLNYTNSHNNQHWKQQCMSN